MLVRLSLPTGLSRRNMRGDREPASRRSSADTVADRRLPARPSRRQAGRAHCRPRGRLYLQPRHRDRRCTRHRQARPLVRTTQTPGRELMHTSPPAPRSPSPAASAPEHAVAAGCAIVSGTTRDKRCAACGASVVRSRQCLACSTCLAYGQQDTTWSASRLSPSTGCATGSYVAYGQQGDE